jgi:hypothetical protein
MILWQGLLLFLGLCTGGLVTGLLASYVIMRMKKRPWPYSRLIFKNSHSKQDVATQSSNEYISDLLSKMVTTNTTIPERDEIKSQKEALRSEIETNLFVSTTPWTGKMSPFQTVAWDSANGSAKPLLGAIHDDVAEAYADMRLANTIVWLSTDVGRKSKDLDESYLNLCNKISERLKKVNPFLTKLGR